MELDFFSQEASGLIRESIYKNSTWSNEVTFTVVIDAKKHSPMSAFLFPVSDDSGLSDEVSHSVIVRSKLLTHILDQSLLHQY